MKTIAAILPWMKENQINAWAPRSSAIAKTPPIHKSAANAVTRANRATGIERSPAAR